jgi:predicted permease
MAVIVAAVPNTGNFGLPLARELGAIANSAGGRGPLAGLSASEILATQAGLIVAANILLWLVAPLYLRARKIIDDTADWRQLLPIMLALGAAQVVSVTGWRVPALVLLPVSLLGDAAVPVMLLALGGTLVSLRARTKGSEHWLVAAGTVTKLVAIPVAVFAWARWTGWWPEPGYQLVFAIAAPTAVLTSQVNQRDSGSAVAERTILWSTALSVATLPAISAVLR